MGDGSIQKLTMPKWGLAMTQGKVVEWLVSEGAEVSAGTEVLEVETEKITGAVESSCAGVLRRQVANAGQEIAVGGLLAVIAPSDVPDGDITQFVDGFSPAEEEEEGKPAELASQYIEVNGRLLHYIKRGDGKTTVVLVHGFGGDLNTWLFNHEVLADNRDVFALDLPGHGQSSKDVGEGTIESLADALQGFLEALALRRVALIGHSLGGATALSVALRNPDLVSSCTLIASVGLGAEIDAEYIQGFVDADRRKQLKPYLERLFARPSLVNRQLVDDTLKFKRLDGVRESLTGIAENFVSDENQAIVLRDRLEGLSVPTCIIWGAEDQIIPSRHADGFSDAIAVHILGDCGHMVHMESAGDVNRIVDEFLRRVE